LISARNPGQTWTLRCEVREKLVAFLQTQQRQRLESADGPAHGEVTTGDNEVAGPVEPQHPAQRTPSPVISDSATR